MFDPVELDVRAALTAAVERRRAADAAEADLLGLAAHWADLHAVLPGQDAAGHAGSRVLDVDGAERLVPLAGEGCPQVAEFAPGELGAALGMSSYAAGCLIGDALELRHRLPRLWERVQAGRLQAWRARKIAQQTTSLSPQAAGFVDAQVATVAHTIGLGRLLRLVDVAQRRFDPDAAAGAERAAADGRHVWVSDEMVHGTRTVLIEADALDVTAFDATLDQIADTLAALGDPDVRDVRRAKAVGVIADPQGTLDLLHTTDTADTADMATSADPDGAQPSQRRRGSMRPRLQLYIHLSEAALTTGTGIARVEDLGPATLDLLKQWLGRTDTADLTVRPVLDLADRTSIDAYETPTPMRETVLLRTPCCPFPWCTNLTRRKDMDHITDYVPPEDGGPPGQTAPHLLGPLCRRHHRYKTTGGWHYTMPEPGSYHWRSPTGRRYLVDHTGTHNLHDTG